MAIRRRDTGDWAIAASYTVAVAAIFPWLLGKWADIRTGPLALARRPAPRAILPMASASSMFSSFSYGFAPHMVSLQHSRVGIVEGKSGVAVSRF